MRDSFRRLAQWMSDGAGRPGTFLAALLLVVAWACTGPLFHYSDTWQLIINTGTSIATFLMVFLIQNSQNRDTKALHVKLDELLRAVRDARGSFVGLEELSDEEIERLRQRVRSEPGGRPPAGGEPQTRAPDDGEAPAAPGRAPDAPPSR